MKTVKLFFLCLTMMLSVNVFSQNQFQWVFGFGAGIEFQNNGGILSPQPLSQYLPIRSAEGSTMAYDNQNRLLFYSDGTKVYQRDGNIMRYSDPILGQVSNLTGSPSSTHAALIAPIDCNNFILFTMAAVENTNRGLSYTYIQFNAANPNGIALFTKPLMAGTVFTEKMAGIRPTGSSDFWLATHTWDDDRFIFYKVDARWQNQNFNPDLGTNLPSSRIVQNIGMVHNGHEQNKWGQMKFSGQVNNTIYLGLINLQGTQIFSFNPNNANPLTIKNTLNNVTGYGLEFTNNNQFLYVTNWLNNGGIFRLDLNLNTPSLTRIQLSNNVLNNLTNPSPLLYSYGGLMMGPDGCIYMGKGAGADYPDQRNRLQSIVRFNQVENLSPSMVTSELIPCVNNSLVQISTLFNASDVLTNPNNGNRFIGTNYIGLPTIVRASCVSSNTCSTPTIRIRPQSTGGGFSDGGVSDTGGQDQSGNINRLKNTINKDRIFEDDVMDRNSTTTSNGSCQNPGKFTFVVQGLGNPTTGTYSLTKNGQPFSSGNFNANSSNQLNNLEEGTYELTITWSENGRTCSAKESLNICKPIEFDNCTSCIPESLYSKDFTETLFSIIPVSVTMDKYTYKIQFNATPDFVNLNINWNNWLNAMIKTMLGNLTRAQQLDCFGKGGFVTVVHEFRLYDITDGVEIEVPSTVFHIGSNSGYNNVNWQSQDHPFKAVLDINRKYKIKHGVYYEANCLKDSAILQELIKACPWKESSLTTDRNIYKSMNNKNIRIRFN